MYYFQHYIFALLLLLALVSAEEPQNEPETVTESPATTEQREQPAPEVICCSPDILIVIDRVAVDQAIYATTIRPLLIQLFESMNPSAQNPCVNYRTSFIEIGSSIHIRSLLGDNKVPANVHRYVEQYTPGSGSLGTKLMLAEAFEGILTQVLTEARGKRPFSPTYVLLFIGSEIANENSAVANAERLRNSNANVQMLVFGIGDKYKSDVAFRIASDRMFFAMEDNKPEFLAIALLPTVCSKTVQLRVMPTRHQNSPVQHSHPVVKPPRRNQIKTRHFDTVSTNNNNNHKQQKTPSDLCLNSEHHNTTTKMLISDPDNCHNFIACVYNNETFAIGTVHRCGPLEIFNKDAMMCVPEGPSPCADYCRHNHMTHNGCYGISNNCAMFFLCSHGTSYVKCCPSDTSFDQETCSCEPNKKCADTCKLSVESEAFKTFAPITSANNNDVCIDAYNNTLRVHRGRPDLYEVVEFEDSDHGEPPSRFFTVPCAQGTIFSKETCRCELFAAPNDNGNVKPALPAFVKGHQCRLYMPFDSDIADHSLNKFAVYREGRVFLNKENDSAVSGGRSLFINDGYLEIPGLAGSDQRNQASWCLFYRCQQRPNSFACLKPGGLFSNNKDSLATTYSIILSSQTKDQINAQIRLTQPATTVDMTIAVETSNSWNQVCVTYDGTMVELYSNGASVAREEAHGRLLVVNFPYLIGTDHRYGSFQGSIDEILMCDHAMSPEEVEAHFDGNRDYLIARGLIPSARL